MNQRLTREQERIEQDSTAATLALNMLAREPGRYNAFVKGLDRYGEAFAAFLLVPEVKEIFAGDLLSMFQQSFRLTGTSQENAMQQLLAHTGWTQTLTALNRERENDAPPPWNEETLREVLSGGYAIIAAIKGVYVFDRRPLIIEYED